MVAEGIRVEGVRDLSRAMKQAGGRELQKQLGRSNKAIGQLVISRLQPLPERVGLGAGAKVRASANARMVQLMAGGAHRAEGGRQLSDIRKRQWGRRYKPRMTKRPNIVGTAIKRTPNIADLYMRGVEAAASGAGLDFDDL
jgi:hypothetical protein